MLEELRQGWPSQVSGDLDTAHLTDEEIRERIPRQSVPLSLPIPTLLTRSARWPPPTASVRARHETVLALPAPPPLADAIGSRWLRIIAGGTNLLDLMKHQIETPARLTDVNHVGLDSGGT